MKNKLSITQKNHIFVAVVTVRPRPDPVVVSVGAEDTEARSTCLVWLEPRLHTPPELPAPATVSPSPPCAPPTMWCTLPATNLSTMIMN